MRLFIAALLDQSTKTSIIQNINDIKGSFIGVKWEKIEKLHITLKFLGNVDSELYEKIKNDLKPELLKINPIHLSVSKFSTFPNLKRARVVVISLHDSIEIQELHKIVEYVCSNNGIKIDSRKFIPHITIGRVKGSFKRVKNTNNPGIEPFIIDKIAIVESKLDSSGSTYKNLDAFEL